MARNDASCALMINSKLKLAAVLVDSYCSLVQCNDQWLEVRTHVEKEHFDHVKRISYLHPIM